jgi:hypothetical protein
MVATSGSHDRGLGARADSSAQLISAHNSSLFGTLLERRTDFSHAVQLG